ncbi:MAG: TonB-dependent receptor, plug, partial [Candidatus Solibacter sp.]|nr:TonB-dependent receptor, plug [Candidatus Solibacter sp.]
MKRFLTIVVGVLLATVLPVRSQTITGSISGSVLDASEGAVANAKIIAVEQERKVTTQTVTDVTGRFVFPQMPPGTYSITVEAAGFKKLRKSNVVLNGNERLALGNLALEIGSVDQSVEVHADALQLQTESGERSETMNTKVLQNIAINGRSYLPLVALIPGVTTAPNLQTAGHAGIGNISANGGRANQNNLTLDGVGDVDTGNNGDQLATISLDSVQEFRVLTSNYQAEYGRSSSAQISVVTKSGTSDFHGSAYWFHRHEGLNANNWKSNRDGQARRDQRYNDLGYTIGGPVFIPNHFNRNKNKLFFFFSQEYQRQLNPQGTRNQTVPTDLERQGNFSASVDKNGIPVTIKDPTTGLPFPGNIIPANRLYAPGIAVLNLYPKTNFLLGPNGLPNRGFNFTSQISDSYPRREDLLRGDYNLSEKWKLFARFVNNSDAVTSYYGSFVLGSAIPLVPIRDARPGEGLATNVTTLISPTMTNEFTWGFGKNTINIDPTTDGLTRAKTGINLPVLYPDAVQKDFIPTFAFNGSRLAGTASFGTNNAPFFNYNTTIEWIDNLSKVWNQHTIKAGIYIQRSRKDQTSFANANGSYDFSDDASNPLDTGFGFANAALGIYRNFTQASKYATGMY